MFYLMLCADDPPLNTSQGLARLREIREQAEPRQRVGRLSPETGSVT